MIYILLEVLSARSLVNLPLDIFGVSWKVLVKVRITPMNKNYSLIAVRRFCSRIACGRLSQLYAQAFYIPQN